MLEITGKNVQIRRRPRRQHGYTMLEILIALAIIGVLAAIAIPKYQDSVRQSRRTDAKATLQNVANAMERTLAATNCYADVLASSSYCPSAPSAWPCSTSNQYYYTTTIALTTSASASCADGYTLTATANSNAAVGLTDQFKDTSCRTFTLTSTGAKGSTDSAGAASTVCW